MSTDIVIVAAARTAVGKFGGTLAATPAPELGAAVINELLKRAKLEGGQIGGELRRFGHCAHGPVRGRVEVARYLHRQPGSGSQLAGPVPEQLGVAGNPLQDGVGQHDVGVGFRCPGGDVTEYRVDAALAGGGHHLRRAIDGLDHGVRPALRQDGGQVSGTAAQVDDAARRLGAGK